MRRLTAWLAGYDEREWRELWILPAVFTAGMAWDSLLRGDWWAMLQAVVLLATVWAWATIGRSYGQDRQKGGDR